MKIYTGCEQGSNTRWRAAKKRYYMLLVRSRGTEQTDVSRKQMEVE